MRIRHSVVRIFGWMVLPALTVAVVGYFGYYAAYGERGYFALHTVRGELAQSDVQLAQLTEHRMRLEHRISLLKSGDPDLIEELARTKLMDGAPGQVAVPRDRQ